MTDEATEFRELYERHTGYVVEGNVKASLADMVPSVVPAVFEGVVVPRGRATSRTILDVRKEGDRWVGDTVYETPDGPIGLRSYWIMHEGAWRAVELENFPVEDAK
ncbi:hypothetical protein FHX41_3443 [Actinomadura hallensis]|uniref:SnoaL-like protein n=1 Tax=Actinomadura hallensis TaxID=337895 RepID=A0A543IGM0_9ACTN|nr:hypothetical protein [Actinomadura hallensis]TQM69735.1 hypothetical protein FHX41_3443 [Actinomadura hallensis]